jgi:hypothetical protein
MDQRIESFLTDVLALAGEDPDAVGEGVRVALADCEASFRARECYAPFRNCSPSSTHSCCTSRRIATVSWDRPPVTAHQLAGSGGTSALAGELTVETRKPDDCRVLGVGERFRVNAGHAHQTSNRGAHDCRFLIMQGIGKYDFKALAGPQRAEVNGAACT